VIVVAPSGKTSGVLWEFLVKLKERQAEAMVISNDESTFTTAHQQMRLPDTTPEWLTPLTAVIPGQIFAMNLALAKGHDLDSPRGLTKVTVTR
jgi:glucosamine--fructose-6-phosphate aminotransferase (isomerizing)